MSAAPYQNPDLPVAERVEDLLSRLTVEEKESRLIEAVAPE